MTPWVNASLTYVVPSRMMSSCHPQRAVMKRPDVILMTQEAVGGLTNEGYWGVPVQAGRHYALSMRLASTQKAGLLPSTTSLLG